MKIMCPPGYHYSGFSLATDEGPSLKLALSEGGSRRNIES